MTLTEASRQSKLFFRFFLVGLGAIIVVRVIFLIYGIVISRPVEPTAQPTVNCVYSPLPPLVIKTVPMNLPVNYSIFLDLVRGILPTNPSVAFIYPVLKAPYGFLSADRAQRLATTFGFTQEPIKLSTTENLWTKVNETLKVNEQTLNFSYQYNYTADPNVLSQGQFSSQAEIQQAAQTNFKKHATLASGPNDLQTTDPKIFLLRYQEQQFLPTRRISEAMAVQVDYARSPITYTLSNQISHTVPFTSPSYVGTLSYILLSKPKIGQLKLIDFNFVLWRFDTNKGAPCALMTNQMAWERLQIDPAAYTVYLGNLSLGPLDKTTRVPLIQTITIKDAWLAYYDSEQQQEFIQPVWVFVGKGKITDGGELDWVGYVPAVHPDHLATPMTSPTSVP